LGFFTGESGVAMMSTSHQNRARHRQTGLIAKGYNACALHLRGSVIVPFYSLGRRRQYEDEGCGNDGFCVFPSHHRRLDFLQEI